MCLTERKEKRRRRRSQPRRPWIRPTVRAVEGGRSGCYGRGRRSMMDPAAQGANPIPSAACVDAKRLRCSAMPDDRLSKVLDDDNTSSWLAPMTPLDDEDLLREILLRLPPKPSSFPRASLVCKLWRCILSDPRFLCRFRKHHRKPPVLGFFDKEWQRAPVFTPMLDPPDRIPVTSFALPENFLSSEPWDFMDGHLSFSFFGCRHGIALFLDYKRLEAVLWDPLSGVQRRVAFPPGFEDCKDKFIWSATVLCPVSDDQYMHGDCDMSSFNLVFACHDTKFTKAFVRIYESKSGVWGDIISTTTTHEISMFRPGVLVGNALCWLLLGGNILEFDFETLALAVIKKPAGVHVYNVDLFSQILRGKDNGLGLAILSNSTQSIQLWARKAKSDGVVSWMLQNTIQLDELFSRPERLAVVMPGYDEDTNAVFLSSKSHDYILQLDSMQFKYIGRREYKDFKMYYPYTNLYTAVRSVAGGGGGAENVNI